MTVWLALKHAFSHVHVFFFFCTWTAISYGFIVNHCSCTVHVLKNIKNRSHDTIYTFKYYFTTVFSVFSFQFSATISSIQTHPMCLTVYTSKFINTSHNQTWPFRKVNWKWCHHNESDRLISHGSPTTIQKRGWLAIYWGSSFFRKTTIDNEFKNKRIAPQLVNYFNHSIIKITI